MLIHSREFLRYYPYRAKEKKNRSLMFLVQNKNSVTSVKYGIQTAAPPFFDGTVPDLIVSGPNVGTNLGLGVLTSGTV